MSPQQKHKQQWLHNRQFLSEIPRGFPDWMVTTSFYIALHAVETLFAHDQVSGVINHQSRNEILGTTRRYTHINKRYKPLYGLARTVRYFAEPQKWVPVEQVQVNVLNRYLFPIEKLVQKLISDSFELDSLQVQQ